MTTSRTVQIFVALLIGIGIAGIPSQASAYNCGPNSVVPDDFIPYMPVFEEGCKKHDDCLDGTAEFGCRSVGYCAAIRNTQWATSCFETFNYDYIPVFLNPALAACMAVAVQFAMWSDQLTCVTGQGCFPSSCVKDCDCALKPLPVLDPVTATAE